MMYTERFLDASCYRRICVNTYIPLLLGTSSQSEGDGFEHSLNRGSALVRGLALGGANGEGVTQ